MGGQAYWYFTAYNEDIESALQALRQEEFQAGRYNPVMPFITFPIDPEATLPGPQHESIEEARAAADVDGTRSILDIESVSEYPDIGVAAPLDQSVLEGLYGTTEPTREMIESNFDFLENVDRGQAVYTTVFKDGKPHQLLFAGYSFD